jgi:hypothetical protein
MDAVSDSLSSATRRVAGRFRTAEA